MPYDNETGLFYQSQGTKIDGTPDGDTVKEGFVQRTAPSVQDVYADMNLLRKIGAIGMPDGVSIVANENDMLSVKTYDINGADDMPLSVGGAKTELAKKANDDLSNVKTVSEDFMTALSGKGLRTITEKWIASDKNSWYIKYSDGWIEQGGYLLIPPLRQGGKVTLPTPFTTLGYFLNLIASTTLSSYASCGYQIKTKTSFNVYFIDITDPADAITWHAYGF